MDPVIASTFEKFKEIQGDPDLIAAISVREADDQAKIQLGRKQRLRNVSATKGMSFQKIT